MKIVHVENYFDPSAGYQINELLRVQKAGVRQVLITSNNMSVFHKNHDPDKDSNFEKHYKVKIIRLEVLFSYSFRLILKNLWKEINQEKPDILFLHGIGDFRDISLFLPRASYITVRDCHMSWIATKNKYYFIFTKVFSAFIAPIINNNSRYKKVFALGAEEYEYLRRIGIKNHKIEMLPHGYSKHFMYFDSLGRDIVRKKISLVKNDILISYIGKFDYAKRPDLIFDIFNIFDKKYLSSKNLHFLFAGPQDQNYMEEIFNVRLNNFKANNMVSVLPPVDFEYLKDYFSASDICIWPKETTLSSIHAQVCGAKVVMEDHVSNRERVLDQGCLFRPNDIAGANKVLGNLIDKNSLIRSTGFTIDDKLAQREYSHQLNKLLILVKKIESVKPERCLI